MSDEWLIEWRRGERLERFPIRRELTLGRSVQCDIVVDDPYVSRIHCTVEVQGDAVVVDARRALNLVRVSGRDVEVARLSSGALCLVGNTAIRVVGPTRINEADTLKLAVRFNSGLMLRRATRELLDGEIAVARFSAAEFAAVEVIAQRYPETATHSELGSAIWEGMGYDQYQIHRLMQRVRQRMGGLGSALENVRGLGYRLQVAVAMT